MSDVVFDEERKSIEKDSEIAQARFGERFTGPRKATIGQNIMMIIFAILCIWVAYAAWNYIHVSSKPIPTLYKEDVTDSTKLRMIPEKEREKFIQSLPSRGGN